jgi:hypothetical protein
MNTLINDVVEDCHNQCLLQEGRREFKDYWNQLER